jgi:hypothetical protein
MPSAFPKSTSDRSGKVLKVPIGCPDCPFERRRCRLGTRGRVHVASTGFLLTRYKRQSSLGRYRKDSLPPGAGGTAVSGTPREAENFPSGESEASEGSATTLIARTAVSFGRHSGSGARPGPPTCDGGTAPLMAGRHSCARRRPARFRVCPAWSTAIARCAPRVRSADATAGTARSNAIPGPRPGPPRARA